MCCKWLSCQCRSHASMARVNTVRCGLFDESVIFTSSESCISFFSFICESVIHSILVFCLFTSPPTDSSLPCPLSAPTSPQMTFHILLLPSSPKCVPFTLHSERDRPARLMLNRTFQKEQLEMKDIQQHVQNSPKNKLESIWHTASQHPQLLSSSDSELPV